MIFVNNSKVHLSLIFFEKDLDVMFDNVLNGKKPFLTSKTSFQHSGTMSIFANFLDLKNVILTEWENFYFS